MPYRYAAVLDQSDTPIGDPKIVGDQSPGDAG
jgi:hypothetical protein